ncbi:MAG TPA: hypothetical protein VNA16_06150 [Abditibacteriaceae bacterium]|nr:hypothetical protein [Abditibacteriaceae bacterium]
MSQTIPCLVDVAYGDPGWAGLPVAVGVPFATGVLRDTASLVVRAPGGEHRPAGGRALAHWPDGSIRWCLVSFGAREKGPHEVLWEGTAQTPEQRVTLHHSGGDWTIDSGRLRLVLSEGGPGPISRLLCDGHEYLSDPSALAFAVDDASSRHEPQRTVRVVEYSPLRARLRIEGAHYRTSGARHLSYRLDVEVWAGWPTLRLDYQFFNLEPGADARQVGRIALDAEWELGPQTERHFLQQNYGLMYVSRHVVNPAPVAIVSDLARGDAHVEDPAMLLDDVAYPYYLHAPLVGTHDWLGVQDGEHAVYVQMHDFLAARPNRIASEGRQLAVEFWPATAGPLELPQGRSRRQTVLLSFVQREQQSPANQTEKLSNAPHQAPQGMAAALGSLWHEERACVAPAWFAHCGEFEQDSVLPFGQHVRIESNLSSFMRLDMPCTKFDVGDTESHYSASYSVINGDLVHPLPGAPAIPRLWPGSGPTQTYLDLHEPVWTNNEYDVIHAFANEIMRTGRQNLLTTLRLAARHNIEVDFLHYSDHKWLHRATPAHSARHTTTGAYPSHFWTQGLLEYYCLSGDEDALEVAVALGDKTLENFADPEMRAVLWGFNREVGWSVLLLAHLYDITREARFKTLLDELVDYLVGYDRDAFSGAVNLSGGDDRHSLNRQIVGNFFGYASMIDAVDKYAAITNRAEVIEWLTKFCYDLVAAGMQAAREGSIPDTRFSVLLSIGYERTGDEQFLAQMGLMLDQVYWNAGGLRGGGSVKPVASAYRGWTRMLGHAQRHGLLEAYEFPSVRKLKG